MMLLAMRRVAMPPICLMGVAVAARASKSDWRRPVAMPSLCAGTGVASRPRPFQGVPRVAAGRRLRVGRLLEAQRGRPRKRRGAKGLLTRRVGLRRNGGQLRRALVRRARRRRVPLIEGEIKAHRFRVARRARNTASQSVQDELHRCVLRVSAMRE